MLFENNLATHSFANVKHLARQAARWFDLAPHHPWLTFLTGEKVGLTGRDSTSPDFPALPVLFPPKRTAGILF
jgi:hypothetical protein